jgi:hypothetical protein
MPRSSPARRTPEAPLDSEQARSFYQRRIALYSRLAFGQSLVFFVLLNAITRSLEPDFRWNEILTFRGNHWHLAAAFFSLPIWLAGRRLTFGDRSLPWLDAIGSAGPMVLYAVMGASAGHPGVRGDAIVLLICMLSQLLRAVLIPSTPGQTAIVGIAMSIPVLALAWWLAPGVAHAPGSAVQPMVTSYIALWCFSTLMTAVLASKVIYGLRQEVRQAQTRPVHPGGQNRRRRHGAACIAHATRSSGVKRPSSCSCRSARGRTI